MGDVSKLSKKQLRKRFKNIYTNKGENWIKTNLTRDTNVLWKFYHEIKPGDIFIARKGRKELIGIGTVIEDAYYSEEEGAKRTPNAESVYNNFIKVQWEPKAINYENIVFGFSTLYPIDLEKFSRLTQIQEEQEIDDESIISSATQAFALEKYLEHFLVKNFKTIKAFE
ncbi:MAG: hypothetical protein GF311_21770 [Candidatus Lokiarchaeota archaeon]|nr:hypothetical protein [Candidatus Lokiarchaeota archaeon]